MPWPYRRRRILAALERIDSKLETLMTEVSQAQADINNATSVVTALLTDIQARVSDANTQLGTLATDLTAIQQQIADGQPVDTAALNTVIGNVAAVQASLDTMDQALDSAVQNVTAVATPPAPPAPAPPGN